MTTILLALNALLYITVLVAIAVISAGVDGRIEQMEKRVRDLERHEEPDDAWLCVCGHCQEDGRCCDHCGKEPPWGCDCGCHDSTPGDVDLDDVDYEWDDYEWDPEAQA